MVREVAGDKGLAHFAAVFGDGDEELEAIGETGEDFADVGHADLLADRRGAIGFKGCPKPVAGEIAEGKVRVVLVVVLADEIEAGGEPVANGLTPRDVIGRGEPLIDEIKGRHEQQRLVRLFVRRTLLNRSGSDVQVVETFNGGGEEHAQREPEYLIGEKGEMEGKPAKFLISAF